MWQVSDRFIESLARDHDVLGYVQLLVSGEVVLTVDGSDTDVLFTGGSVTVQPGYIRRTASLTLVDNANAPTLTPVEDKGLLIVGQVEVRMWSGLRYWDWTAAERAAGDEARAAGAPFQAPDVEFVPAITGPITNVNLDDYPTVQLTVSDRGWYLSQPFTSTYVPVSTATLDDSIASLLAFKILATKLETNLPATDQLTGFLTFDQQTVPGDKLQDMATTAGWTIYTDPMGVWQATSEPDIASSDPVMTYSAGPGGALIQPQLHYDVDETVNTWVVTGESVGTDTAVPYAKVTDDDPNSPTYVRVPADERPKFINAPTATTDGQCLLIGQTHRARERGLAGAVQVVIVPNPAHDRGDVCLVDGGLLSSRLFVADTFSFSVPTADAMTLVARVQTADVTP